MFWNKFAHKGYFWSKTEKNDHHPWIRHLRISLGTKIQFRVTILISLSKFNQKRYFQSKKENANITI